MEDKSKHLENEEPINFGLTILGVIFGCFLLLGFYSSQTPSEYALTQASGKLQNVERQGRRGASIVIIEIDGFTSKFGYGFEANCGDVYKKLLPLKGEVIKIKYNPQDLVTPLISDNHFRIYDLKHDNLEICTYFDIYEGNEKSRKFGYLLGSFIILSCVSPFIKKIL